MNVYGSVLGSSGGGTSNYNDLSNKPSINGVTLSGNKTSSDLGISGSSITYSTSEQLIGKWVDGSNLYQKTIIATCPTVTSEGTRVSSETSIGAIPSKIVGCDAILWAGSFGFVPGWDFINPSNNRIQFDIRFRRSDGVIEIFTSNAAWNDCPVYVTIRYTK